MPWFWGSTDRSGQGGEAGVGRGEYGPGEQVDTGEGEFEPRGVVVELAEQEPAEAGVFAPADAVLDPGAGAVASSSSSSEQAVRRLVGDEHLMAHAFDLVEQAQLRAGGPFASHDHSRAGRVGAQVDQVGDLADLCPVAQFPVAVDGRDPVQAGGDRGATGSVIATPTEKCVRTPCWRRLRT